MDGLHVRPKLYELLLARETDESSSGSQTVQ